MAYRDENIRYLRPLWIRLGLTYLALIGGMTLILMLATGSFAAIFSGLLVFGFLIAYVRQRRRLVGRDALRAPSPDAAARALFGALAGGVSKRSRPFLVTGTASIHVVYGGVDRAEELLATIDWTNTPPLLRGDALIVRAMIDYVRGDYAAGLAKARCVPELMDVPALAPGANVTRRSGAMLIDIGAALAEHDAAAIDRLRDAQRFKRHIVLRGLAAWALWRVGDRDAERWLAVSRELLPYAYGLGVDRPAPAAHVVTVADPANPYAAPSKHASADIPYDPTVKPAGSWVRVGFLALWILVLVASLLFIHLSHR